MMIRPWFCFHINRSLLCLYGIIVGAFYQQFALLNPFLYMWVRKDSFYLNMCMVTDGCIQVFCLAYIVIHVLANGADQFPDVAMFFFAFRNSRLHHRMNRVPIPTLPWYPNDRYRYPRFPSLSTFYIVTSCTNHENIADSLVENQFYRYSGVGTAYYNSKGSLMRSCFFHSVYIRAGIDAFSLT